jgi:hypothetical protein
VLGGRVVNKGRELFCWRGKLTRTQRRSRTQAKLLVCYVRRMTKTAHCVTANLLGSWAVSARVVPIRVVRVCATV